MFVGKRFDHRWKCNVWRDRNQAEIYIRSEAGYPQSFGGDFRVVKTLKEALTYVISMFAPDKYLKIIQWSEEDDCYVGTPGLVRGGVHGDDETTVCRELCGLVEKAIELYGVDDRPLPPATANKEYSGRFVLRVEKELHLNACHPGHA